MYILKYSSIYVYIYIIMFLFLLRPNSEGFVCMNWKGREGGGMEGRIQKLHISRRHTHRGACCESTALLWLRNMGQRSERTL